MSKENTPFIMVEPILEDNTGDELLEMLRKDVAYGNADPGTINSDQILNC